MRTICGIDITKLAKPPTPNELGMILAHMNSHEQAEFFMVMGEELRNCCGGREFMQWQYIADAIKELEERVLDSSGSQLILEISGRLYPEDQAKEDARREEARKRYAREDDKCEKCGFLMNGERAQVGNEIWCHPCADAPLTRDQRRMGND